MTVEDVNTAQNYKKGTTVWLPCVNEIWIGGVVVEDFAWDGVLRVQLDDGSLKEIQIKDSSSLPFLRNPEFLIDSNDLTTLSYLHEPDVLYSLKYRFDLAQIYTYCGIVLVAINPYRECDLYGTNIFALYRDRNVRQLDPHIYAVAEEAFASLTRYNKSQSIIVSGESGAGKTVSAKYVMHYLAEACSFSQKRSDDQRIEKKVLASNPIMEAIGNAKTVRNDNSSRFGKFIQLLFTERFQMCGAQMRTYLLEKSRVVNQGKDERNYHIFYQICAARNKETMLKDLGLNAPDRFFYLNKGGCVQVNEIDDAECFFETKEAMKLIGITDDQLKQIFRILSGLLHFGNVNFEQTASQECTLDNETSDQHLIVACKLWGVQESGLRKWLRYRLLTAGSETIHQGLNVSQAKGARDATAKFVYLNLFIWIVKKINDCLEVSSMENNNNNVKQNLLRFVGVLDIYGFEIFDLNSFEQLCINYANELLQQQFNQHVFKLEQAEYVKEGIQWSFINFHDNQPCLDLIEGRLGILDLLDQECKMPSANDENWLNVMSNQTQCNKSPHFALPRIRKKPGEFVINHFASGVTYKVQGFVEKNMDSVNAEQLNVLKYSTCSLLALLIEKDGVLPVQQTQKSNYKLTALNGPAPASLTAKKCLASQFRESLRNLKSILDSTMPHYVRCIKPNDEKLPFTFNVSRTVEQLRACGVLETIRISAAGYPSRWIYDEFKNRYRLLLSKQKHKDALKNSRRVAELVCSTYLQAGKFELGKTKIFFRTGQVALLESLRSEKLRASAVMIQKIFRGYVARKRYVKIRNSVRTIQAAGRAWVAWRYAKFIQMHRAAILLQKTIRRFVVCKRYVEIRTAVLGIQKRWKGKVIRHKLAQIRYNQRITMIQRYCRGFLVRRQLKRKNQAAVVIQCWVRRFLARKLLKRLKVEAKSVEHLENLNKGLENKIISLQQRVDKTAAERENFKKEAALLPQIKSTLDSATLDLEQSRKRILELEMEVKNLREQLSTFEEDAFKSRQIAETEIVTLNETKSKLNDQLVAAKEKLSELERQLEQEKTDRARLQEEFDVFSTTASSLQLAARKDDAVSVSSLDLPESQEDKKIDGGAPLTLLLDMERQLDKSIREKERILQKIHDNNLLKELQNSSDSKHQTMFSSLLELLKSEVLEIENQKLRQELDRFVTESSSGKPELHSLLESQRKEIERRLEESIMLRTLLAEQFEAGSKKEKDSVSQESEKLRVLLIEQKKCIRSLTEDLASRDQRLIEVRNEIERLRGDNERQQVLLLEKLEADELDDVSVTSDVKDNEITRLLAEKLALKKQIEAKNRSIKKLRVAYDAKHPSEEPTLSVGRGGRQSLGMIQVLNAEQFLRLMIKDFTSSMALNLQPALPAFVIFMAMRYEDHVEHEEQLMNLFGQAFTCVEDMTKDRLDFDTLALWLANVWRLVQLCRQYSGEEEYIKFNTPRQNDFQLKRYDLTDFRVKLGELATRIYSKLIIDVLEPLFVSSKIVGAVLEFEANVGLFNMNGGDKRTTTDLMKRFLEELNFAHDRLMAFGIEWPLMKQIFQQLFRLIEAHSLNELMFRRDLCNFNKGVAIKHNVGTLCNWLRDRNLSPVVSELDRLSQATNLLQMRKTEQDIEAINEHGSLLNVAQIVKLMTHYSSMDGIEPKIPVSFIRKLESSLRHSRQLKDNVAPSVYLPITLTSAVDFPYVPSNVLLDSVEVPKFLEPYTCLF